jgi:4-carboxymuconolactone decarboxylase
MARIPHLSAEDASPEVAAALAAGPQLGVFSLMAQAQSAFRPWLRWGAALLTELELDPVLRELAILRVAAVTPGAEYEWVQHEPIARGVGATEAQIAGARTGVESPGFSGDALLVVTFTEQVVVDVKPTDEVWATAAARFSPRELVELMQVIGQYMMLARIMATVEIDPDGPGDPSNVGRMREAGRG